MDIVNHYSIGVGISIDGLKHQHDKYRVYPSGRGSFDHVVANIKKFQNKAISTTPKLGVISVITDYSSAAETYKYLTEKLNIDRMIFLFPDKNHDERNLSEKKSINIGKALTECFELWAKNTNVHFKNVTDYIETFQKKDYINTVDSEYIRKDLSTAIFFRLIIVRSDGELNYYDRSLPIGSKKYLHDNKKNILNINLLEYLTSEIFHKIHKINKNIPSKCLECRYVKFCSGGDLEHRFSENNGFDNPSVYCEDLRFFFKYIENKLQKHGLSQQHIDEKLLN